MEWLGWVFAAIAILVAAGWRRQLVAERVRNNDLVCAKLEADNRLDALAAQQSSKVDADVFVDMAGRFDARLQAADEQLERAAAAIGDYRECVRQFDAAVQYCLQPVELIFGADKASLDRLVHHVEGARRKLFDARGQVEKHPLHRSAGALDEVAGVVHALNQEVAELRARAAPSAAATDDGPKGADPRRDAAAAH